MLKYGLLCILFMLPTSAQAADYFDGRFKPGYEWLQQGEFDQAQESFEQLKTDTPNSEWVDYSIASVIYERARSLRDTEDVEGAIEQFLEAKSRFSTLARTKDSFLREQAPLNAANSTAQIAKLYTPEEQYKERVQGLKNALVDYDTFLGEFSGHPVAQRNRDHVSYLLKQLLRNPPPEQEEEQEGEEGEEESEGEESEGEEQENEQEDEPEPSSPQQGEEGKSPEEQNIEAILESLEAVNQEEQKNLRKSKQYPRVKQGGQWW